MHLRSVIPPTGLFMKPEHIDALLNTFDFRWSVTALRKAGHVAPGTHFCLELLDQLHELADHLGLADKVLPGHRRTRYGEPVVLHTMHTLYRTYMLTTTCLNWRFWSTRRTHVGEAWIDVRP